MDLDKNMQEHLQELQLAEQNMQNLSLQKQAFQIEFNETESALEEIEKSSGDMYKITGQIMVKAEKEDLIKELNEKQKILQLRIKAIEKQEQILSERANAIKQEFEEKFKAKKK